MVCPLQHGDNPIDGGVRFVFQFTNPHPALCSRRHLPASMCSCLSVCVLLSLLSSVCVAVGSTSLFCAVRSVSKTLAREVGVVLEEERVSP